MSAKARPSEADGDVPMPVGSDVTYIVMYSGGLSSYEAARRCIEQYGKDRVRLWFADTQVEDEDLYRFNEDVKRILDLDIRTFAQYDPEGNVMDIWDVMKKERFIANSRIDPCSKLIKRKPLRKALEEEYNPENVVVVLGMDNIEDCHRVERARFHHRPFAVYYPLLEGEPPFKVHIHSSVVTEPPTISESPSSILENSCASTIVRATCCSRLRKGFLWNAFTEVRRLYKAQYLHKESPLKRPCIFNAPPRRRPCRRALASGALRRRMFCASIRRAKSDRKCRARG